jgi:hypothetical protein
LRGVVFIGQRLKCRSCRTPRYSPRVHMIKLTEQREITPRF